MKVSYNNDIITLTPDLKVTAASPYPFTNTVVTFTIPSGLSYVSSLPSQGTYNKTQKKWYVGEVPGNSNAVLKDFKLKVTNINNAPFTVTATVTASELDNNSANNTFEWVIEADTCSPTAGANPDTSSCLCGSVGANDTRCTKGETQWRINEQTITNGELKSWDVLTGDYEFAYDNDPSLPINFTYNLYCVQGANEFLIAQNVPVTIRGQITDRRAFDHTTAKLSYADLSAGDIAVLQEQYPDIILSGYCWDVIKNSHGEVTSGHPLICDDTIDTKVTYQSIAVSFLPQEPNVGVTLPTEPSEGDMHIVRYPNAVVFFLFNGISWSRSDFNPLMLTGEVSTDPVTKIITLETINGNNIEIDIDSFFV